MGEVVVPGENGFIVDVSTPEGLIRVLCEIDADPARFTKPPARQPPLRSAADQARELIALYDAMMG
jgi:hypothetical protein